MRVLSIFSAVLISLNMLACSSGNNGSQEQIAKDVNAEEMHKLISEKGGQILDVRTNEEVAAGYITGAVQMNFYDEDFDNQVAGLDKSKPVYVYCAAGGRSGQAMNKMKNMGFKEVYNLAGGYPKWVAAGFDTSK